MRNRTSTSLTAVAAACAALLSASTAAASLTRNAAGARNIGETGRLVLDTATELERESDGRTWTLETGLQYQLSNRLQLLLEALPIESVRAREGDGVTGLGDTDVTLSWLALAAHGWRPSVVLGGKLKVPTATREAIGTSKADGSALLVLGRESGELEVSLETEYVVYGQPGGTKLENQFLYSVTAEYGLNDFLAVYGEAFGISRPTKHDTRTDAARIGVEFDVPVREWLAPYLSLETSTEGITVARAGVEWAW